MTNPDQFQLLCEWAGSQAELARRLGLQRAAVNHWRRNGIPADRAIQIEALTGGKFKAADLYQRDSAA